MSKKEKLEARLKTLPKDFTWDELKTLMKYRGFKLIKGSGSRRKYFHETHKLMLIIHKPHPGNILKDYNLEDAVEILKELDACE